MNNFDDFDQSFEEKPRRLPFTIWDVLTIVVLMATLCLGGYFLMIFVNPYTALNPLPPPSPIPPLLFPTATITPLQLEPTWTPTATIAPTPSITPRPTWTPIFTETPFSLVTPSKTPVPTPTPKRPYILSKIDALPSTLMPQLESAGCNWLGVGGSITDANNADVPGIVVHLGGTLDEKNVDVLTVSGVSPAYGKSGFEIVLSDHPIASNDTLWIQLQDLANLPLSERVYFSTYTDCQKNLILIRFRKVR